MKFKYIHLNSVLHWYYGVVAWFVLEEAQHKHTVYYIANVQQGNTLFAMPVMNNAISTIGKQNWKPNLAFQIDGSPQPVVSEKKYYFTCLISKF